jgi:hypothetical protein
MEVEIELRADPKCTITAGGVLLLICIITLKPRGEKYTSL